MIDVFNNKMADVMKFRCEKIIVTDNKGQTTVYRGKMLILTEDPFGIILMDLALPRDAIFIKSSDVYDFHIVMEERE